MNFLALQKSRFHCPIDNTCTRTLTCTSVHTLTPCFSEFGIDMTFTILPFHLMAVIYVVDQAVSRRLPIAAARVRSHDKSCEICDEKSGTGAGFLRVLRLPLPILIPPNAPYSSRTSTTYPVWFWGCSPRKFRHLGQFFMEPSDYYDAPIYKVLHFIRGVGLIKG
jgi:hypothetical protein